MSLPNFWTINSPTSPSNFQISAEPKSVRIFMLVNDNFMANGTHSNLNNAHTLSWLTPNKGNYNNIIYTYDLT